MFIRTIKMINERKDQTIRRLLAGDHAAASRTGAPLADAAAAADRYNEPSGKHQRSDDVRVKLEPMIEFIADRQSAFEADGKVCQLIESGVHALVGPLDGGSVEHVQSICDNMEIPYFELRPFLGSPPAASSAPQPASAFTAALPSGELPAPSAALSAPSMKLPSQVSPKSINNSQQQQQQQQQRSFVSAEDLLTLNLHPPAHSLTSAYIDLIYAWNWTSFAIVYEEGNSMIKLQDLFRESSGSWTSKWQIKLFQFDSTTRQQQQNPSPASGGATAAPAGEQKSNQSTTRQTSANKSRARGFTFRDIFWRIKLSGEQNILLDVKTENLYEALKQAQQVGCMTERFSYLITSLDLHTLDLEDFKYSRTRITGFSIINVIRSSSSTSSSGSGHLHSSRSASQDADTQGEEELPSTSNSGLVIDDKYLERLGVHVSSSSSPSSSARPAATAEESSSSRSAPGARRAATTSPAGAGQAGQAGSKSKYRLSPSVTLERSGSFMDPPQDAYHRDWFRREMLQSSPASMGLLPSVDRDNELRLFEFFVEQQEQSNLSRVKLSTASAILHDSLILLLRGLHELDPSGDLLLEDNSRQDGEAGDARQFCSPANSRPWLHGSSLANYMRQARIRGLTGNVGFDQRGLRAQFKLDMLGMAPDVGLVKVGEWHSQYDWRAHRTAVALAAQQAATTQQHHHTSARPTYDELSEEYDLELKRYERLLATGAKVDVPYTKPMWRPALAQRFGLSQQDQTAPASGMAEGESDAIIQQRNRLLEQYNGPALLVNDIIFERLYREQADQIDTLIVTTKLSQPYFMLKETPNKLEGNDQYEGFAVDLVHELSKLINFKYRWREVADKKYGSKEVLPNGTVVWNGMIGELLRGQADLAIVDLTITAQREEAVDFTLPFMNTGISILFKKPTTKVTTLFSFLSPFSKDVWAYVLAAYCGISANLFLVGHLSPYEWADPHPCRHSYEREAGGGGGGGGGGSDNDSTDASTRDSTTETSATTTKLLENQFSLLNSFWFTIGSLMQQGSDLTPRSMSTRTIAGIWYFFTLIMISSYTANLAAFLTVEKVVYPIENVRDLSQQTEIKFGCVESGSTCTFFHDSQIDTYRRITETMRRFNTYVRSNDEGQKRVEEGKFAYFMESASIEYIVERNCNLTQIGGLLDSKGYGLATSKRSRLKRPYRTLLSEGILHLQETGMLHVLKNRWWKERRGGGTCTDDGKGGGVTELSLANVGGVFVVLLGGLGISFLVAIAEFMWRARRGGSSRDRICEEMMNDLKFALACKSSTKPISLERQQSRREKRHELLRQQSSGSSSGQLAPSSKKKQQRSDTNYAQFIADAATTSSAAGEPFQLQRNATVNGCIEHSLSPNNNNNNFNHVVEQQQHKERRQQAAAVKECDPILLHAMLTMLQQQQQQPYVGEAAATARQLEPSNEPPPAQQQRHNSRLSKRRLLFAQRTIDMDEDAAAAGSTSVDHHAKRLNKQQHWRQ